MAGSNRVPDDALQVVADVAAAASDLAGLVRPLLELVTRVSPYEVAYLSVHDRHSGDQLWRFVHVAGGVGPPEGGRWPWEEVLCHWVATRGRRTITDLAEEIPGHPSNLHLGVRGFVSIPYSIVGRAGEVAGTLCASSSQPVEPGPELLRVLELFATVVADRFGREIELGHERIRADAAERTLEERTRFLAATEHTIKTPLAVAQGWARTLDDSYDELDEQVRRDAVARVRSAADRLAGHVDQLLREAHASLLGSQLEPSLLRLGEVLPPLVAEWAAIADGLEITAGELAGSVLLDMHVLEQVLGHLLENAMKYAAGGTAVVSASVSGDEVILRVADDGPGLADGVDLFDAFTRGDGTRHVPGSGLGMYIVRQLVERSGGRVRASNGPDGGACFDVLLPAQG